ncbi:DUF4369 domain-containing protein [Hymenobacter sp. IS2118]|uniref:DUF4369 domain-containing protein n=1 Tax=Hymenobacter sp. IS2118 TaxID=1505605 RepID=UPI0005530A11|nr:DUF4369 domain-containing protein [Hymenobacter sp. IS2118]
MKKLLLLQAGLLLAARLSCAQNPAGYRVIGDVQGLPAGSKVYLINGSLLRAIDSATVQKNHFELAGRLAEPTHMYLHAGKGRASVKLADILLDNRTVRVQGEQPDYNRIVVTGSDIDQHWKDWYRDDTELGTQRYKIRLVAEALTQKQDTANANALRRVMAAVQQSRVRLLKDYVARYHDSATGAMLPNLCTLGPLLTAADYQQMYQSLTPTWQQSTFGKEMLLLAQKKPAK